MKILYLGEISPGQTCRMRMRALERLGHELVGVDTVAPWRNAGWLRRQWQRRLARGSVVEAINESVLAAARQLRPELVWADKQEFLRAGTVEALRRLGARTLHFTPDPYFTLSWKRTPLMDEAMRAFDLLAYCKAYEREDYEALGKPLVYLPLGYCDETHRPLVSDDPQWSCAVGFLGGWEPRREVLLGAVARALPDEGIEGGGLKIWGGHWDFLADGRATLRRRLILRQLAGEEPFAIRRDPVLAPCLRGGEVYGDDYARALSGARIGVGFLRQTWPDQHTTRSFEIPACGSLLLADRTDEHREFFEEGVEAEFFGDEAELLDKVKFYAANEAARARIAAAGRRRCDTGGYSYLERMRGALESIGHRA